MSRRGRPSATVLAERKRRKKAWARQEEDRRQMESRIAQGLVARISFDEMLRLHPQGGKLDDKNVIVALPVLPPASQFMSDKLKGVSIKHIVSRYRLAMIDLLNSDVPLDSNIRKLIAGEMWKLLHPEREKHDKLRRKAVWVKVKLAEAADRGVGPEEAREKVAAAFGHPSGDSLRKWMDAHQHLLDDDGARNMEDFLRGFPN